MSLYLNRLRLGSVTLNATKSSGPLANWTEVAAPEIAAMRALGRFVLQNVSWNGFYVWLEPSINLTFYSLAIGGYGRTTVYATLNASGLTCPREPAELGPLWDWFANESCRWSWLFNMSSLTERWRRDVLEVLSANDTADRVRISTCATRMEDGYVVDCAVRSAGPLPSAVTWWNVPGGSGRQTRGYRLPDGTLETRYSQLVADPSKCVCYATGYRWSVTSPVELNARQYVAAPVDIDEDEWMRRMAAISVVASVGLLLLAALAALVRDLRTSPERSGYEALK